MVFRNCFNSVVFLELFQQCGISELFQQYGIFRTVSTVWYFCFIFHFINHKHLKKRVVFVGDQNEGDINLLETNIRHTKQQYNACF